MSDKKSKESTFSYEKLLLDAMRMVPYKEGTEPLTNEGLTKAVTMNENLMSLGYTLKPADVVKIAASPSVNTLYDDIKKQMTSVKAKPMYPDFPTQVMEMDEAQFRMHQIIHYFSTYGMEFFTGQEVSKGWLPAEDGLVSDTEKTETDTRLLAANAVELLEEKDKYRVPFARILSKNERMTEMEKEIIHRCVVSKEIPFDRKYNIPFKENMEPIFCLIAEAAANKEIDRKTASAALYNICQHPGDVTRGIHKYLLQHNYKLHTAEKKMFVDTYEKYGKAPFIENVTVSNKKVQFTREIFNRIDFKKYAHDADKIEAVNNIGHMRTWEAQARQKIENKEPDAISFAAQRPGMLIRMTSMALRNGYSEGEIAEALKEKSANISMQTTVSLINEARKEGHKSPVGYRKTTERINREMAKASRALNMIDNEKNKHIQARLSSLEEKRVKLDEKEVKRFEKKAQTSDATERIFTEALKSRLEQIDIGMRGKNVYLDESAFDFSAIAVNPAEKNTNQGYLPSATVVKIPDEVNRVRCFVYWDDSSRVDLDLHVSALDKNGHDVHIGWNGGYNESGVVFSGDITHSNAAEYIDVDLANTDARFVKMTLDSFTEQPFSEIETVFSGMMAVDKLGENVHLYDPANCFFSNDITNDCININYGEIDVQNRLLRFIGREQDRADTYIPPKVVDGMFSLKEYLTMLANAQEATIVDAPENADVVLTLCKPMSEKDVSLIDNNFFYEAEIETEEKKKERKLEKAIKEVKEAVENNKILTPEEPKTPDMPENTEPKNEKSIDGMKSAKSLDDVFKIIDDIFSAAKKEYKENHEDHTSHDGKKSDNPGTTGPGE